MPAPKKDFILSDLKVYYPHGGHHFLLHWWSYNERGHIILARTQDGIISTAKSVFKKHTDAEIKAYIEIDIVAPSELMHKQAKEAAIQERIDSLYFEVIHRLRFAIASGKNLPKQFAICTKYNPGKHDRGRKESTDTEHYSCKSCSNRIKLARGMTKEKLYNQYNDEWSKAFPVKQYTNPKHVLSCAEPVQDTKGLYFVEGCFGHHCTGLVLEKAKERDFPPSYLNDPLFFYHKIRELDSTDIQSMLENQKLMLENFRKTQAEARNLRLEEDKRLDIEKTISVFE